MSWLSNIDYGAVLVWRRNADVFFKTWKTNFLPSILEPLLYLVAMGAGLGGLIVGLKYAGQDIGYVRFLAPGLVAISIMYGGFFECTYGSFVRMHYQKTFDAIVATPVSLEDVIAGEILWGASKSFLNSTIVLLVIGHGVTFVPEVLFAAPTMLLIPAYPSGWNHVLFRHIHRPGAQHRLVQLPVLPSGHPMFLFRARSSPPHPQCY